MWVALNVDVMSSERGGLLSRRYGVRRREVKIHVGLHAAAAAAHKSFSCTHTKYRTFRHILDLAARGADSHQPLHSLRRRRPCRRLHLEEVPTHVAIRHPLFLPLPFCSRSSKTSGLFNRVSSSLTQTLGFRTERLVKRVRV